MTALGVCTVKTNTRQMRLFSCFLTVSRLEDIVNEEFTETSTESD